MPLDDSVFALADVLLLIEEGEDPGGLFNITVNIGSGLHQNVDISGQSRRLIQNQHQAGPTFKTEGHTDTFYCFQQAECVESALDQARVGSIFLLKPPDVIQLINSFVDHFVSSNTMVVSSRMKSRIAFSIPLRRAYRNILPWLMWYF